MHSSLMFNLEVEKNIFNKGFSSLVGIDEAGRGPLAGPVVAGCVLIDKNFEINNEKLKKIKDSKKLTPKRREDLFEFITDNFKTGIGICDEGVIDRINILQATFLAMKKAMGDLKIKPEFIIIDGKFPIPNCSYPQKAIISGDKNVFTIAAASIIAKVYRDRLMKVYDEQYPEYGFAKHKGYGTKIHLEQIKKLGACPIHRKSFKPIKS